eukprot:177448-Prymnesium_polylepis.1
MHFRTQIWVGSTWPLGVIVAGAGCLIGSEFVQEECRRSSDQGLEERIHTAVAAGLKRVLPPTLGLTFLVVPSTSTRIFRTLRDVRV